MKKGSDKVPTPQNRAMTSAGSVVGARPDSHRVGGGSIPTSALQLLRVAVIAFHVAKVFIAGHHYLRSFPGGTHLAFGAFLGHRLVGVMTLGVGPSQVYRLVEGAVPINCLALTRFCLVDELPTNSESRILGVILRALKKQTGVMFIVAYADSAQGHVGTIYQASNWIYTGLSQATPLYSLGGQPPRHSRSLSHSYGTRDAVYFAAHGVDLRKVPQQPKHRYIYFLDPAWRPRLRVEAKPYPKLEKPLDK